MYEYAAQVVSVVDGDTFHLTVDLGFDIKVNMTVRLYGVNAPEMSTEAGRLAKAWVNSWILENCGTGRCTLRSYKDRKEKYGRYLGTIISPSGKELNADLVAAGMAVYKDY